MNIEDLLDRLAEGDDAAADAVFREYEPLLRAVVRRQLDAKLRAKFDSIDVVQSMWADLLGGFRRGLWRFDSVDQLKAFLKRAARNRFLNRVRRHRTAREHEVPLDGTHEPRDANTARPSQVMQADDRWQLILADCPAQHRELLKLKREGVPLDKLAERTGMHASSVRRVLYDLARKHADPE